jgi:ABC-type lipopolysaccharide export system ATPase subunit
MNCGSNFASITASSLDMLVCWCVQQSFSLEKDSATRGDKLSGGGKRKLSLAIALIGQPPVLCLGRRWLVLICIRIE